MRLISPSTQALLQAVLAPDTDPDAIARWQAATNFERLEVGQFHLLPLLYRQMERTADDHPWLPRLKGIYRRTWVANQLAFKAAQEALEVLAAAGQSALLVGPAALALTLYADPATRPIGVAQVLTPIADRPAAMRALTAAGWQPSPATDDQLAPRYERWRSSQLFVKPFSANETLQVRLCWHGLPLAPAPAWSAQWFDRAAPLANATITARTLDPTDQLLQALTAVPALELIPLVDGQRLITRYPIDWPRLVHMARQSRLTLMLAERLELVQEMGALPLPSQWLAELSQTASPGYADAAWRLDQINPWERTAWQRLRLSHALFQQQAAAQGIPPHPGNFYNYLRAQLGTVSLSATLRRGLHKMATRAALPHGY
jgi:hypothetical protein